MSDPLERLSRDLGGPKIYVKRDDCTGLAFGGNKTRKLEFLMADALAHSGRSTEAISLLENAMMLNPFYPDQYLWHLGGCYFNLKEYERAIEEIKKMNNPAEGRRILAACYGHLGKVEEARLHAAKVMEAHPEFTLENWGAVQPDRNPDDVEHFIEGLRRAGLN